MLYSDKLTDSTLPSYIYVREVWITGLFDLLKKFNEYSHKVRRYPTTDLKKPFDDWINALLLMYLYVRSQLQKEVIKNKKIKYTEASEILDKFLYENKDISFENGRIATLLLNDFCFDIGLTEVTKERIIPSKIMEKPY